MTHRDRALLSVLGAYTAMLLAMPFLLPYPTFKFAFSEAGPFERLSIVAWLVAAAIVVLRVRPYRLSAAAFTAVYLLFAAREADWQKAFTTRSISKLNYYKDSSIALSERIVAALAVLVILTVLAYVLVLSIRYLRRQDGLRTRAGLWLAVGGGLLVFCKLVDRSGAVLLRYFDYTRGPSLDGISAALEEGLELAAPIALALSAWFCRPGGAYMSRSKAPEDPPGRNAKDSRLR